MRQYIRIKIHENYIQICVFIVYFRPQLRYWLLIKMNLTWLWEKHNIKIYKTYRQVCSYINKTRHFVVNWKLTRRFVVNVGFTTTYVSSAYHHSRCQFESRSWQGVLDTTLCDNVCQWLAKGRWFSVGTPVSCTNTTDRHDIKNKTYKTTTTNIRHIK
jgi:hypothetical protein